MAAHGVERVLSVHHWNSTLRAYSIASANHDEYLEFFSIKVAHAALTSRLQASVEREVMGVRP